MATQNFFGVEYPEGDIIGFSVVDTREGKALAIRIEGGDRRTGQHVDMTAILPNGVLEELFTGLMNNFCERKQEDNIVNIPQGELIRG
jgi:hypothetical protein